MYSIFVVINVKPEHTRDFREATLRGARHGIINEPDVCQFHILTDPGNPNRFYFFEIFRNEAAAMAHFGTENFKSWWSTVEGMLDGEIQKTGPMETMIPSDPVLEQQRAALLDWFERA